MNDKNTKATKARADVKRCQKNLDKARKDRKGASFRYGSDWSKQGRTIARADDRCDKWEWELGAAKARLAKIEKSGE
jgi:hypothetical protein